MDHRYIPSYQIRKSKKAKRPQMTYSSQKGLEIVVPDKIKTTFDVEAFVYTNKDWIFKQIKKTPPKQQFCFPDNIDIKFLQRNYRINYMFGKGRCKYIERPDFSLVFIGDVDEEKFKKTIKKWLFLLAKKNLIAYLDQLSKDFNLDYNDASIRSQLTIWGSCSADKNISINYKLLFLPEYLARYILIHELCHTVHLDHSDKFWQLVKKFDPNYLQHKKILSSEIELNFSWLD